MLQPVRRVLRIVLLVTGVLLTAWLPLSFVRGVLVTDGCTFATSAQGEVQIARLTRKAADGSWKGAKRPLETYLVEGTPFRQRSALLASYSSTDYQQRDRLTISVVVLGVPLWLLAVLCLAWPVTSFVIARRRRRTREFEVEPSQRAKVGTAEHSVVKDEG